MLWIKENESRCKKKSRSCPSPERDRKKFSQFLHDSAIFGQLWHGLPGCPSWKHLKARAQRIWRPICWWRAKSHLPPRTSCWPPSNKTWAANFFAGALALQTWCFIVLSIEIPIVQKNADFFHVNRWYFSWFPDVHLFYLWFAISSCGVTGFF